MIEKVNPSHPDKVADRIAGAIVDLAYKKTENPKIAVEVLIGHGNCHIIAETSVSFEPLEVRAIVDRILDGAPIFVDYKEVPQDEHLADNQSQRLRCGDNGIFKGFYTDEEEFALSATVKGFYLKWPTDGKFIWNAKDKTFIVCQSNAKKEELMEYATLWFGPDAKIAINPLGDWTGGTDVDTGATNRKLGSDMGRAVTGGGLHGKDLSKADVSVNIACHLLAQRELCEVRALCAIGDDDIKFEFYRDGKQFDETRMPYPGVVAMAENYIKHLGGFEKLAEWGLV